ncbi:MAG: hypothetical protein ABJK20_13540, partial [Halieaceae bacterium]
TRYAYNLQVDIDLDGQALALGLDPTQLPGRVAEGNSAGQQPQPEQDTMAAADAEESRAQTAEALFDDLASMLRKRQAKSITED